MARARHQLPGLRQDLFAATCVFLLGLPLSLGAALASGAPAAAGLTAAAIGGMVGGLVAGAPLMVTGPVVALATLSHRLTSGWDVGVLAAVTVAAGLLQLAFAALRLGRFALAVAPAVLEGMLAGVGLTLLTTQGLVILDTASRGRLWRNLAALPEALGHARPHEVGLAVGVLAITWAWERTRFKQALPAMLVSLVAAASWAQLAGWQDVRFIRLPSDGAGPWHLAWAQLAARSWPAAGAWVQLAGLAVEMALVCSVYSLLSAASLDRTTQRPAAKLNRELAGQGLANTLSGLFGGLPVSGAVLRSTANIRAGAQSSRAAFLQGACMVLALTQFRGLLGFVPVSALAANFLQLGLRLISPARLRTHLRAREGLPFVATALGGVSLNLFAGVVLGLLASALQTLTRLSRLKIRLVQRRHGHWQVQVRGIACFFQVPRMLETLAALPAADAAEICLETRYCDAAFAHAMDTWCHARAQAGGSARVVRGAALPRLEPPQTKAA